MMKLSPSQCQDFLNNGYLVIPHIVPQATIDRALSLIDNSLRSDRSLGQMHKYAASTFCQDILEAPEILALIQNFTVQEILTDIFGQDTLHPPTPQIALRFPEFLDTPNPQPFHLDGFPTDLNQVQPGKLYRQTALLGIYLSRTEQFNMGNFTVWSGSHRHFEQFFRSFDAKSLLRQYGTSALFAKIQAEDLGSGTQLIVEPGDIVIAHGALAHAVASNLSLQIRYAVYFRLYHRQDNPHDVEVFKNSDRFFENLTECLSSRKT